DERALDRTLARDRQGFVKVRRRCRQHTPRDRLPRRLAMRAVRFSLLGRVEVRQPDASVLHLPSRKALALLTYLAMRPGELQPRDKLAALLWGDTSQERARHSLRQALVTIRAALDGIAPPTLVERGDTVAVDATVIDVDVSRFELLVASDDPESLAE